MARNSVKLQKILFRLENFQSVWVGTAENNFSWKQFLFRFGKFQSCVQNSGYGSKFGTVKLRKIPFRLENFQSVWVGTAENNFSWKQFLFRFGKFQSCVQNPGYGSKFGRVTEHSIPSRKFPVCLDWKISVQLETISVSAWKIQVLRAKFRSCLENR